MSTSQLVTRGAEHRFLEWGQRWTLQSDSCIPPRPGPSDWRPGSSS